jgi:hypothetical protein
MSWTLSSSGAAIAKAGANANAAIIASTATLALWSDEAEGKLCTLTRKDWIKDYVAITSSFKPILDDTISDMIAQKIIVYDASGYTSRYEAELMLDAIENNVSKNISILNDMSYQEKMV